MALEPSIAEFVKELPRNWKAVCLASLRYLLIGIVGMAILGVMTALYKVAVAQITVGQVERIYV